jgi:hypothetical protein
MTLRAHLHLLLASVALTAFVLGCGAGLFLLIIFVL